jgi:hypothetical protein
MLKLRGLGLMGLLVFSGVTVGALPAFAQTHKSTTQAKPPHRSATRALERKLAVADRTIKKPDVHRPKP